MIYANEIYIFLFLLLLSMTRIWVIRLWGNLKRILYDGSV